MPDRNASNDRDKFDHSNHPTARPLPTDLHAPGAVDVRAADGTSRLRAGRKTSRVRRLDSRSSSTR